MTSSLPALADAQNISREGVLACPSSPRVSVRDESGATAIEYGLIVALIALAIVVGASQLGNAINTEFVGVAGVHERFREVISAGADYCARPSKRAALLFRSDTPSRLINRRALA